jgi:hypothetical protein
MPSRLLRKAQHAGWILLLGSVIAVTACGGTTSAGSWPTPSATSTSPTTPTPSPTRSADVGSAVVAALALYARSANNLSNPSAGYVWSASASMPVSTRLRERLSWLNNHDYFADTNCGENYVDGNQVGLTRAPNAVSATSNSDGTVTVVLRGYLNDNYRDLTVLMSLIHGTWLATDLRRGTGPNASVFSSHPNC